MSQPDLTTVELRAVGRTWRGVGAGLVLIAAILLFVAKARNFGLHSSVMIAGFAILALGWVLTFVGIWLRMRHAKRREL